MQLDKADKFTLAAAFISFLFSISLWFGVLGEGNRDTAIFVGLWVPSILALGIYGNATRREA
jgi:CO dehydrogenase/acetyl-CoA synthase epsilon subunit